MLNALHMIWAWRLVAGSLQHDAKARLILLAILSLARQETSKSMQSIFLCIYVLAINNESLYTQ